MRRILVVCTILVLGVVVTGCRTLNFYAQAAKGQLKLLSAREPISELMKSTNTPAKLKARFEVLAELREFAEKELALPVNGHYMQYADVKRDPVTRLLVRQLR